MGEMGECGIAYFYLSRILGKLVEVPPATYRTLHIDEFRRAAKQSHQTGNPACTYSWSVLRSRSDRNTRVSCSRAENSSSESIAENPRGEDSSPPGYWTLDRIRQKRFYRVLSSREPVGETLDLADPACLQDLALAHDLARGVILDEIFKQIDPARKHQHRPPRPLQSTARGWRSGRTISTRRTRGRADHPGLGPRPHPFKDNDDGMMWGERSISVSPLLEETRHLDPVGVFPPAMAGRPDAGCGRRGRGVTGSFFSRSCG